MSNSHTLQKQRIRVGETSEAYTVVYEICTLIFNVFIIIIYMALYISTTIKIQKSTCIYIYIDKSVCPHIYIYFLVDM